jgi:hypothetical protein
MHILYENTYVFLRISTLHVLSIYESKKKKIQTNAVEDTAVKSTPSPKHTSP